MDYFMQLLFGAAPRLKCGAELELVAPESEDSEDYLDLGGYRIEYAFVDHEDFDDYILNLKYNAGLVSRTFENYALVERTVTTKWLVAPCFVPSVGEDLEFEEDGDYDLWVSSELILLNDLAADSRVLAYCLDAMYKAAQALEEVI